MKKREGVTSVTPVRHPKRVGKSGRQVRINWEGKISFGKRLVDEIELDEYWSMILKENKEENILYLDFSDESLQGWEREGIYFSRREKKTNGGFVVNCREGLRGVSIEKIRHLVNQTKENKTITSICDYEPTVINEKDELVIEVKIT